MGRRPDLLLASAVLAALAFAACRDGGTGASVERVSPTPITPGAECLIEGRGFGGAATPGDQISLDGRALAVVEWGPERLRARVAADQRAGEVWLVVRAGGETLAPFGVEVGGDARPELGGPPDLPDRDGPVPPDAFTPPTDARLPDGTLEGARAEFIPDPDSGRGVHLSARPSPAGELWVDVVADSAWGVAFHLLWDPNLMSFVSATPVSGLDGPRPVVWRVLEPGRLAFGGLQAEDGAPLLSLRFALIGTGEGRVDFPGRFASARAPGNIAVGAGDWHWHGGTVRSRVGEP